MAQRAGNVQRFFDARVPRELADSAVAYWEAEAERRGLERRSVECWREGHRWLDRMTIRR
jgi:hypothetical protein